MFPSESHVDELFEIGIYEDTTADLSFNTHSVKNEGGYLAIEPYWDQPRTTYQIGQRTLTRQELDYIRNFFAARRGQAVSFLWRDYSDHHQDEYEFLNPTASNSQTRFQLYRHQIDGRGHIYSQPVDRVIPGTVRLYRDGTELQGGLPFTFTFTDAWRVENGEIVFLYPPTSGVYTVTYDFYKVVRFDTDKFNARFDAYVQSTGDALYFCSDLRLIEIRLNSLNYPSLTFQGSAGPKAYRMNFTVVFKNGVEHPYENRGINSSIFNLNGFPFYGPVLGVFVDTREEGDLSFHGVSPYLLVRARSSPNAPITDLELAYDRYGISTPFLIDIFNDNGFGSFRAAVVAIKDITLFEVSE